jgi:hypothetical protein
LPWLYYAKSCLPTAAETYHDDNEFQNGIRAYGIRKITE